MLKQSTLKKIIFIALTTVAISFSLLVSLYTYGRFLVDGNLIEALFVERPTWGYPEAKPHINPGKLTGLKIQISEFTTRAAPKNIKAQEHLIFLGGSFTYGWELNDYQTLAWKMADNFEAISLAYPGWATNHIYERLMHLDLSKIITKKNGYMYYNFLHFHVERLCGLDSYMNWGQGLGPYYDDSLNYQGLFKDSWKYHSYILKHSLQNIRSLFQASTQANNNGLYPSHCLEKLIQLTKGLQKKYYDFYPAGKFKIMLMPNTYQDHFYENLFKKHNFEIINAHKDFYQYIKSNQLPIHHFLLDDGHPSEKYFDWLANYLKKNLITTN